MKKTILLLFALIAITSALISPVYALNIPEPVSVYVGDYADVIDSDVEDYIISKGEYLCGATGAQICIVTVDFLDGEDIEDVCYEIFNEWGIGDDAEDNGVLLLMTIGDDNYWCMPGDGISRQPLSPGDLKVILNDYLEPDFAAKDYSDGARKVFDALYNKLYDYYDLDNQAGGNKDPNDTDYVPVPPSGGSYSRSSGFKSFLLVLLVVVIIVCLFSSKARKRSNNYNRTNNRLFFFPTRTPRRPNNNYYNQPSNRRNNSGVFGSGGLFDGDDHDDDDFGGGGSRGGGAGRG